MIKTRLVGLLSHAKKYIVYTILWQWAALLSQVVAVFTIANLLERVVYRAVTIPVIEQTILILVVVVIIRFVCERMGARSSYLACVDVKRILREKIYEKMLKLGASYSEQVSSSEVVQVSTEGVEQLETYFGKYLPQLFYSLIAPLTLFIILCRVSLKASVILLICVPLIPISIVVVQKIAKKLLSNYWSIYTGLGDSFLENLQGLTTLKIYQADQQKADEMDVESQNFRRITMKVLTMQLNSTSVMDIVAYGGAAIGMAASVSEFLKGNISVAGALCIVLLASEFFLPLRLLGSFFHIAMNGMAASDKIFKILDLPEPQAGEKTLPEVALDVTLKDVHFSYEKDREILKGINLNLPAGSFVSLVGESGCGKSTIAGILAAKNREYNGEIAIGGVPLNEVNETNLMQRVVLVRHNSYLFKGTVEENLKMAKPDATKEEMEAVLQKVNLLGLIKPNLILIVTASFGFMRGQKEGMLVGFFAGLITDIQFGTILGFYALLYLVIGFVNGLFEQLYFDEDIKLPLFLISVSEFLYGIIIYLLMFMLRSDFNFLYYLNRIIVPELIYTIVITLGLYPLILFINHKLEAEEKRSASKFV